MRMQKGQSIRPSLSQGTHEVTVREINTEYDADTIFGPKDLFVIEYCSKRGKSIKQKYIAYYDESSSFGKVVKAVLGELPEEFDTQNLVGKPCKITVEPKRSKQGKVYNNVVKVEPSEKPSIQNEANALFDELD